MSPTVGQKAISILSTLMIVALLTTLVLPGRETPGVIREFFAGLAKAVTAAIGRG